MKDAIDKRNDRERIARSVVKRRNIVYITQEELERKQREEAKQQERETAESLAKQLREDENKKKAMEIERLLVEQKMLEKQLETGMDATGKHPMDDVTQERVEAILSEKSKQLQDIIATNTLELAQEDEPVEVSIPEENQGNDAGAETNPVENDLPIAGTGTEEAVSDAETGQEENIPVEEVSYPEDMSASPETDVPTAGETEEIQEMPDIEDVPETKNTDEEETEA